MSSKTPRHMDDFAKLKPENLQRLQVLVRLKSTAAVARMLHTSVVTLDNLCSPMGGAKKLTIKRVEEALARLDSV